MYAVIETGGKQYKVKKDDIVDVEKLGELKQDTVSFSNVLLISNADNLTLGRPYIKNAKVTAQVVRDLKSKKVISFKYRRRKSSKTTKGHRQQLTRVKVKEIHA